MDATAPASPSPQDTVAFPKGFADAVYDLGCRNPLIRDGECVVAEIDNTHWAVVGPEPRWWDDDASSSCVSRLVARLTGVWLATFVSTSATITTYLHRG